MHKLFWILTDKEGRIKIYNFNENTYVFVCRDDEWDKHGWREIDGISFKEKLKVLQFSTDVVWKKIYDEELYDLLRFHRILSPKSILMDVKNQEITMYIRYKVRRQRLRFYVEIAS